MRPITSPSKYIIWSDDSHTTFDAPRWVLEEAFRTFNVKIISTPENPARFYFFQNPPITSPNALNGPKLQSLDIRLNTLKGLDYDYIETPWQIPARIAADRLNSSLVKQAKTNWLIYKAGSGKVEVGTIKWVRWDPFSQRFYSEPSDHCRKKISVSVNVGFAPPELAHALDKDSESQL